MPRKARIEYAGALYHVMDRGDRLEPIFLDDGDRLIFLKTLGEACERTGWRVHAYVLMGNHYHLLLETPEANLSLGMQWLQSTYTIRHNVKHRLRGHLFQGRFKAVLVDGSDGVYFRTVADYIHLNPVRAGLEEVKELLLAYAWSSFPALVGLSEKRPKWLTGDFVMGWGGNQDDWAGRRQYREALECRAEEERQGGSIDKEMLKGLRRGWFFGSEDFRQECLERESQSRVDVKQASDRHDEAEAERLIEAAKKDLGVFDLESRGKGSPEKIAVAAVVKARTIVTNLCLAERLKMGHPSRVSHYWRKAQANEEVQQLVRQLENSICKA